MKKSSKKYFGFTLVELIIVITILAILATIAFVSFQNYTSQTRDTKRLSDLNQISKGVEIYQIGVGIVPTPDNPKTLTGGNSTLLVGKINSKVLKTLSNNVLDPVSGTEYTYATIGNGKYYQIGADSENLVTSVFTNTYADAKSTIVKGNYLFDPSLPSLIISSGSSLYDPNNCFVVNGGTNLVSNSVGCTTKANTSLKSFDSSLVGYWDMETTTGTMLKDLSGNGNDLTVIGTTNVSNIIGNARLFTKSNNDYTNVINNNTLNFSGSVSVSSIINIKSQPTTQFNVFRKGLYNPYGIYISGWTGTLQITCSYFDTNNSWNSNTVSKKYININEDLFVTCVYNQSDNTNTIFLNGIKNNTKNGVGIPKQNTDDLQIGNKQYDYYDGTIDDTKLYNRALSDDEILQQAKTAGF